MKKAVAVPYIIALILGVSVIGLVGYWFASSGGKFAGQSAITICENKFLQFCIGKSGDEAYSTFTSQTEECKSIPSSYEKCSNLVGSSPATVPPSPARPAPDQPSSGSVCGDREQDCRGNSLDCSFCGAGRWSCRNGKCTPD